MLGDPQFLKLKIINHFLESSLLHFFLKNFILERHDLNKDSLFKHIVNHTKVFLWLLHLINKSFLVVLTFKPNSHSSKLNPDLIFCYCISSPSCAFSRILPDWVYIMVIRLQSEKCLKLWKCSRILFSVCCGKSFPVLQ